MTEHEDNRVHYLIDACEVRGHLDIKPDDLSLILIHQRELGKEDALAGLAKHDKEVKNKTIEEMRNVFCEDFFNRFAWDDGTMNFNNCSLMMCEIIDKLKEGDEA